LIRQCRAPFASTGCCCLDRMAVGNSDCYNDWVVSQSEYSRTNDEAWMREALSLARHAAEQGEVPVGAVVVYEGRIIGRGYNRKEVDQDPTAHAEIIALRESATALNNWRLAGATMYCTLEPCPMCAGAMIQARLGRLVYGACDERFGANGTVVDVLGSELFNHRVDIQRGILEEEAARIIREFFQSLRR
jgi:tRNA(adenine34) deaminase